MTRSLTLAADNTASPGFTPPSDADAGAHLCLATQSPAVAKMLRALERYAAIPEVTLLLEGESGTGKTVLARYIHDRSPRRARPFREISLAALDDTLATSELFGHRKGAFTDAKTDRLGHFVHAHGGTLFLDEIGRASLAVQQRLLAVVESGTFFPLGGDRAARVDVRLLAASNVALKTLVDRGQFLPDLYARLKTFTIRVPPLRERREDVPMLAAAFVARHARAAGYLTPPTLDPALLDALMRAPWPHNIRELEGVIHRLLIDADGAPRLSLAHCPSLSDGPRPVAPPRPAPLTAAAVEEALRAARNNKSEAARRLGVSRRTMYRKLAERGAPARSYQDTRDTLSHPRHLETMP